MPPLDRASAFASAPLADLFSILLRQLKRPMAAHGLTLTDADANRIAAALAQREAFPESVALSTSLAALAEESAIVLRGMGLASYEQSLDTQMNAISGWQSTAEFLDIANEKTNAELRISLSGALLLAQGDRRWGTALLHVAAGDYDDETAIACRALAFAAGIAPDSPDFLPQITSWLKA